MCNMLIFKGILMQTVGTFSSQINPPPQKREIYLLNNLWKSVIVNSSYLGGVGLQMMFFKRVCPE